MILALVLGVGIPNHMVLRHVVQTALLGISRVLSGNFSAWEIAMTIVVGAASVVGISAFARMRSSLSFLNRLAAFVLFGAVQFACLRISFLPAIAHR